MATAATQPNRSSRTNVPANTGALLLLALVAVLTAAGFIVVLNARYATGEGYPDYSSLRSDPLGSRALFEALDRMPNVETKRNFERLDKLKGDRSETLVLADVDAGVFNSPKGIDGEALQQWVLGGGRLVITLSPKADAAKFDRMLRQAEEDLEKEDEAREAKKKADEKAKAKEPRESSKANPEAKPSANVKADEPAESAPEKASESATPREEEKKAEKEESKDDATKKRMKRFGIRIKHEKSLAEVLKLTAHVTNGYVAKLDGGAELEPNAALPVVVADLPEWFSNAYFDDDPKQDFTAEWRSEVRQREGRYNKTLKEEEQEKADEEAKAKAQLDGKPVEPSPWRILARRGDRAMILERSLGTGTVVVCSDSYFLSNEALWKDPKPQFLAWLVGDAKRVLFDETHLGNSIGDQAGIMTLARKYGMHGLFIVGVGLFGLFIWRNATSLVPRDDKADLGLWRADAVAGQSSASGLEGLLRRGIGQRDLLRRCFEVWSSTRSATAAVPEKRRVEAHRLLDEALVAKGKSSLSVSVIYQQLRDALHGR